MVMYSYGDYLSDMREHHDNLLAATWKYGVRSGELTPEQYRLVQRRLSSLAANDLCLMNPYAREPWELHLRRAIEACRLQRGPMFMATIIDFTWNMPRGCWTFEREVILESILVAVDVNLHRLDHLLLIEFAPLDYPGQKVVAAHLQGFVFGRLPERRKRELNKRFAGGLAGAKSCKFTPVDNFVGASRYNVKPPDHLEVCFERRDGRRRHRGRELPLKDHYFLWRHLRRYTYPKLTLASGRGRDVVDLAREAAGLPV